MDTKKSSTYSSIMKLGKNVNHTIHIKVNNNFRDGLFGKDTTNFNPQVINHIDNHIWNTVFRELSTQIKFSILF